MFSSGSVVLDVASPLVLTYPQESTKEVRI